MDHTFVLEHIKLEFEVHYNRARKLQEIFRLDTTPVYVAEGSEGIVYHASVPAEDGIVLEKAIKIVPVIAVDLTDMNAELDLEEIYNILSEIIETNDLPVKSEISNWAAASSCEHILPLDSSYKIIKWQSDGLIGIDYALPMPLAECLTEKIDRYKKKKTGVSTEKEETIIHIGIELCKALEELENLSTPICHRDIKPANIYYFENHYCLGDFGIAIETDKTQRTGTGTEAYRAPEQVMHCEQSRRDHRQDIYSLGLVLYEMADTHRMYEYINDLRSQRPLPHLVSKYSEGLNQILHKATQYYIEARFQHGSEFREALENLLADKEFTLYDEEERYIITKYPQDNGNPYAEVEELFSAETLWNAGHFWYEKSQEEGNRFANLKINEKIMPQAAKYTEKEQMFPIYIYEQNDEAHTRIKLSEIISETASLTDMYLIGEGGTGKTTALYSIMKNTYNNDFSLDVSTKTFIPLFIELSKAPVRYVNAYKDFSSTFIRRYIYFLIKSQREKCNTAEVDKLFSDLMSMEDPKEIEQLDRLLMKEDSRYQYVLLLDGLNEISRKQFIEDESGNSGSAVEMILYEIQKLQAYKNVTVIITSRADEAEYLETDIAKYCLSGLDNETIKEYLKEHQISTEGIEDNGRLIGTLRIPLFLKLYCQLSTTAEISTPGEILYAFFNECNREYSARIRLSEISNAQQQFRVPHTANLITEKMQLFIMDFLLPEIGWYMVKNELYVVDKETIRDIIEPVLTREKDTDICGKYGRAFFREYHRGNDGSINTQTYAKQLMELNSNNNYIEDIVEYCVYSLGIFYVNNQEYSFIHQHIRDFFAALKIITDIKFAMGIYHTDKVSAMECVHELNNTLLDEVVSRFMSDLSRTLSMKHGYYFYLVALEIYRNIYNDEAALGVKNIAHIIYEVQGDLSNIDFSELDLRNVQLYGINISDSEFTDALIDRKNFLPMGKIIDSIDVLVDGAFSPDYKHVLILEYERFRIFNVKSLHEEFVSPKYENNYYYSKKVAYSQSGSIFFILKESYSESFLIEVWDAQKYKLITCKKLLKRFHRNIDFDFLYRHFIKISLDDRYLIVSSNFDQFTLYPIFSKDKKKKIFLEKHTPLNIKARLFQDCPCVAVDPCQKYIAFENPCSGLFSLKVSLYNAETLKYDKHIIISALEEQEHICHLLFSPNGKYLAIFSNKNIYIVNIFTQLIYRTLAVKTKYGKIDSYRGEFLICGFELCLLLKDASYKKTKYFLWSIKQNNLELFPGEKEYFRIFDCLQNSVLLGRFSDLKIQRIHPSGSNMQILYDGSYKNPADGNNAFYTLDHKYLIIYSDVCVQIRESSTYELLHELISKKEISAICCSNAELYVGYSNGDIEVIEMERYRIVQCITICSKIEKIMLSPMQKYIMVEYHDDAYEDKGSTFSLYSAILLTHIFDFHGQKFLFDSLDEQIMISTKRKGMEHQSKMMELWSVKKQDSNEIHQVKCLKTAYWKDILKNVEECDWKWIGIISRWIFVPNTNKLLFYVRHDYFGKLFVWNLDTWVCERCVDTMVPCNFFSKSDNFYSAEFGTDKLTMKMRNLKTLRYDFEVQLEKTNDITMRTKVYEREILIPQRDRVRILDLTTKEYKTIFFLPGIHVQNAKFTQLHPSSDIDDSFLESLKMHGAIIE